MTMEELNKTEGPGQAGQAGATDLEQTAEQAPEADSQELRDFEECFEDRFEGLTQYIIEVYRVNEDRRRSRSYLCSYDSEIPDKDVVGEKYGGGRFMLMGKHPITKKFYSKFYNLDKKVFDEIHLKKYPPAPEPGQLGSSTIANPFNQLKDAAEAIKSLMPMAAPANNVNDPLKLMGGVTDMFMSGLKKVNNAIIDQKLDQMKEPEPEEDKNDLQYVLKLIADYGQKFLEAKGSQEQLFKQLIKGDEGFKRLQEDRDLILEIYDEGCERPDIGKGKMDTLFKKLGVEIPPEEEMPAPEEEIKESVQNG